jgi:hypothetical protein
MPSNALARESFWVPKICGQEDVKKSISKVAVNSAQKKSLHDPV